MYANNPVTISWFENKTYNIIVYGANIDNIVISAV